MSSGKSYKHLARSSSTVEKVHKHLGKLVWRSSYNPSILIRQTAEFQEYKNLGRAPYISGKSCGGGGRTDENEQTALCEVYRSRGPFAGADLGQAEGMVGALTLGIGDVLMIPSAIKKRRKMGEEYYFITFWYDQHGNYVAHFRGDIRDGSSSRWGG